jgi:outer membrane protein OmpA-like peptidoglycan-associated protein
MKRARIHWLGSLAGLAVSTAFASSCSSPTHLPASATTPTARPVSVSTWPITQVEYGRQAAFARCVPPACPSVTPKTLALEPRPVPAVALPNAATGSLAAGESFPPATAGTPRAAPEVVKAALSDEPLTRQAVVHFAFGDATLSPAARELIDEVAGSLASARHIVIRGRTDSVGPPRNNQWLATARANAVRDHLHSRYPHLAPAVALEAQGACCFAASNATQQGRALNRRVEVLFERDAEAL